jgi:hypothetical protein
VSPTFTGAPIAPTAAAGTSTTQIATAAFVQAAHPGYLFGLTLSRSSATVLGIAAGTAVNSTGATGIVLASAFTKSTAGAWAAGTGNNGMGTALTIANDTWYHVFAIINAGAADVYFDTSVSAANAPASTTAFRRIGSFLTNGSAQIIDFVQYGDEFFWVAATTDFNADPLTNPVTLNVPLGVSATWVGTGEIVNSAGLSFSIVLYDSGQTSAGHTLKAAGTGTSTNVTIAAQLRVRAGTAQTVATSTSGTSGGNVILTGRGWVDRRGRDA